MTMITLTFPDGASREFAAGITGTELAAGISKSLARKAVALMVDNLEMAVETLHSKGFHAINEDELKHFEQP